MQRCKLYLVSGISTRQVTPLEWQGFASLCCHSVSSALQILESTHNSELLQHRSAPKPLLWSSELLLLLLKVLFSISRNLLSAQNVLLFSQEIAVLENILFTSCYQQSHWHCRGSSAPGLRRSVGWRKWALRNKRLALVLIVSCSQLRIISGVNVTDLYRFGKTNLGSNSHFPWGSWIYRIFPRACTIQCLSIQSECFSGLWCDQKLVLFPLWKLMFMQFKFLYRLYHPFLQITHKHV